MSLVRPLLPSNFDSVARLGDEVSVSYYIRRKWIGPRSGRGIHEFHSDGDDVLFTFNIQLTPRIYRGGRLHLRYEVEAGRGTSHPPLQQNQGYTWRNRGTEHSVSPVENPTPTGFWRYNLLILIREAE